MSENPKKAPESADVEVGLEGDDIYVPTNTETGLSTEEVEKALEKWGPNEIPAPYTPLYMIFLRQFMGFLPLLIELAAIVAIAVQDYIDFAIIAGILLINGLLGFREEYHAKKALEEVSNSVESAIAVRRDGEVKSISTKELVPGDVVLLVGGTIVPADTKVSSMNRTCRFYAACAYALLEYLVA